MAEAATPIKVAIAKGGGTVEFFTSKTGDNPGDDPGIPDNVYAAALAIGFKDLLNRGMSKIKSPKGLIGEDKEKSMAAAMEVANKNLANLRAGKLPRMAGVKSSDDKIPGVVMTEARRLAKNLIKDEIKASGGKISHFEPKDITAAANAYLETDEGKAMIVQAQANVEARAKAIEEKPKATIEALQEKLGISVSAAKVAKAEAKKKASQEAGAAVLSAAKAGQVKTRTKGAPANT